MNCFVFVLILVCTRTEIATSAKVSYGSGNLLLGREDQLTVNSTCGLNGKSEYCIITDDTNNPCHVCDSSNRSSDSLLSHRKENMIKTFESRKDRWWQAENFEKLVTIEFSPETIFQLEYVYMKFKSFRPRKMVIDISSDFGQTWRALRYFSNSCIKDFPYVARTVSTDVEPFCTEDYSYSTPSQHGEVIVKLLKDQAVISPDLSQWLQFSNLRIRLLDLHTLGDSTFDAAVKRKYFYAIENLEIHGKCFCNNYADYCSPVKGFNNSNVQVFGSCLCLQNTAGEHCEKCKPGYFSVPKLRKNSSIFQPCKKCECNGHSDNCRFNEDNFRRASNIEGICINCRNNTRGDNCEQCRSGYYREKSALLLKDKCIKCNCYGSDIDFKDGTNCNPATGACFCKNNKQGLACNECRDEFYLQNGVCRPCNCYFGGALHNVCNKQTGQCSCRNHFSDRRCYTLENQYFAADNTFLRIELEEESVDNAISINYNDIHWTGAGYVKLSPGDLIRAEFNSLDGNEHHFIPISGKYEPVLRLVNVNKQFSGFGWDKNNLDIVPLSPISDSCVLLSLDESLNATFDISTLENYMVLPNSLCLNEEGSYRLSLKIGSPHSGYNSEYLYLDSIILKPNLRQLGIFANRKTEEEYWFNKCEIRSLLMVDTDMCRDISISIGTEMYDKVFDCDCNQRWSYNNSCDKVGGQCPCKRNYAGRKCDRCISGMFKYLGECHECNCHPDGARGSYCLPSSGQCHCKEGYTSLKCDKCDVGTYSFPSCYKCDCSGLSKDCDENGVCTSCMHHTTGPHCSQCEIGYFGDPMRGIKCRPCLCPGGSGSRAQFASDCNIHSISDNAISMKCNCDPGHTGDRCDECSYGYFGKPYLGIACQRCNCSTNDIYDQVTCDNVTGICSNCPKNKGGDHCESCKPHMYKLNGGCVDCGCSTVGTDFTKCELNSSTCGSCDVNTGQCPCREFMIGRTCSKCKDEYFINANLTCQSCECSTFGAYDGSCLPNGQCRCRSGYSGRKCDQCPVNEFGDPEHECHVCNCNVLGSKHLQCDRKTGECTCKEAIGGVKCNICAYDSEGVFPNCIKCGECFQNWDIKIKDMFQKATDYIERLKDLVRTGIYGAFKEKFSTLITYTDRIQTMLALRNATAGTLSGIEGDLQIIGNTIKLLEQELQNEQSQIPSVINKYQPLFTLSVSLNSTLIYLDDKIQQCSDETTQILNEDLVEERLAKMKTVKDEFDKASAKYKLVTSVINNSTNIRNQMQKDLESNVQFLRGNAESKFTALQIELSEFEKQIKNNLDDMNLKVCGYPEKQCGRCSGDTCQKCGEGSFCNSAVWYTNAANQYILNATQMLLEKMFGTKKVDNQYQFSKAQLIELHAYANMTLDLARVSLEKAKNLQDSLDDLRSRLEQFETNSSKTNDILQYLNEINQVSKRVPSWPEIYAFLNRTLFTNEMLIKLDELVRIADVELKTAEELLQNSTELLNLAEKIVDLQTQFTKDAASSNRTIDEIQQIFERINGTVRARYIPKLNKLNESVAKNQDKVNKQLLEISKIEKELESTNLTAIEDAINKLIKENKQTTDDSKSILKESNDVLANISSLLNEIDVMNNQSANAANDADDIYSDVNRLLIKIKTETQELEDLLDETSQLDLKMAAIKDEMTPLEEEMEKYVNRISTISKDLRTCFS